MATRRSAGGGVIAFAVAAEHEELLVAIVRSRTSCGGVVPAEVEPAVQALAKIRRRRLLLARLRRSRLH